MEKAIFGGGCFWCTEAVFKSLKGVSRVLPGYAGGIEADATYEKVSSGTTNHAEVIYIEYNPVEIKYHDLLTIFFVSHDPTTPNRQGNDVGTQYRSVIFYATDSQKREAEKFIKNINGAVTEVVPLKEFFEAESYHQNYYESHKDAPYCQVVINPKLDKVKDKFSELMKNMNEDELIKDVMWNKGTEAPFSGKYVHTKDNVMYLCKNCGNKLFSSESKFDSGTGWPSFDDPVNKENIDLVPDDSHGMHRTEVACKKCRAHLGHIFEDGSTKTGKRYCINSVCLDLVDTEKEGV